MNKITKTLSILTVTFLIYKLVFAKKKPSKTPNSPSFITISKDLKKLKFEEKFRNSKIIYIAMIGAESRADGGDRNESVGDSLAIDNGSSPINVLECSNLEGKRHLINHLKPEIHFDSEHIELRNIRLEIIKV